MSKRLSELEYAELLSRREIKNRPRVPTVGESGEAPTRWVASTEPKMFFTVPGDPVTKPRQTQSDKWKQRPCVVKYRKWADKARRCAGEVPLMPEQLHISVYVPFPKCWGDALRKTLQGQPHRHSGDADNYLKACADALYPRGDEMIHHMSATKRWEDERGPRVEIMIY